MKDLFDTAGLVTTYGSALFADHVPARTAEVVRLLEGAGYANVGKTNLHEFAYGTTSQNEHFGTVPNPLREGRIAGGSSGGSAAALAAGLADAALGTDSGGSIRIPAACCGVVGFKPSFGLVSLDGCFPLAASFDHAGPMARTVEACEAMMGALVPGFPSDNLSLGDLRAGVLWLDRCDPLVRERVQAAAELFPDRCPVELPLIHETTSPAFQREVADVHRDLFADNEDAYGSNVRGKIARCLAVSDAEYATAARLRTEYHELAAALFDDLNLLVAPTLAFVAPRVDVVESEVRTSMIQFTYPFNALGWPALALPCGPAEDGLPASVQLVGPPGADSLVLAAGRSLQASLDRGTARG